ncbi:hypothetical protein ACTG10_23145 [Aeromonas hydrophila]
MSFLIAPARKGTFTALHCHPQALHQGGGARCWRLLVAGQLC